MTKTNTETQGKSASNRKFIGFRVDEDKAAHLQGVADARGISLNELLNNMIDDLQDPEGTAVERVDRGMNQEQDNADELHRNIDRLHVLMRVQERLAAEQKDHETQKPSGFLEEVFDAKRLADWTSKAKALQRKYQELSEKIEALTETVLAEDAETDIDTDQSSSAEPEEPGSIDNSMPGTKLQKKDAATEVQGEQPRKKAGGLFSRVVQVLNEPL